MKKKFLALLLVCMMLAASVAVAENTFVPGVYTGEAYGMGHLAVEVTLSENRIESITVTDNNETPSIGGEVLKTLPDAIVAAQSTQLDAVSSATITSNALFTAVNNALISAGVDPTQLVPVTQEASDEVTEIATDVVIVGAGGAGMTAAIKLHEQGYQVVVLEKQAFVGGATAMASGSALCQGSRVQAEQGIEDSAELCMMELLVVGDFENDATPTWLLAKYSGAAIDWLSDEIGVKYKEDCGSASAEYSVGRARMPESGSGSGLCADLKAKLDERNIPVMLNTRATELTDENGQVNGVLAYDVNTNAQYKLSCKAVLLATGGYCYDDDYIDPSLKSLPNSGSKANTGDGIDMALKYGAVLQNMNKVAVAGHGIRIGDSSHHTQGQSKTAYKTTGTILVDTTGHRFANELGRHAVLFPAMKEVGRCFMLMDQAAFDAYITSTIKAGYVTQEQVDQWLEENGTGVTVMAHADTIKEVAELVGVDGDNLVAEVEKYNTFVANGEDTDFGRPVSIALSSEGPYYMVEQVLRYSTTLGGVTINSNLQIVDGMNEAIPGLYAAGEFVGGVFGANFPPSTGVGWALTSGMLAGEAIAAYIAD